MAYKYDFEEKHEERMVSYVKSGSSWLSRQEFETFVNRAPKDLDSLKEYYKSKRKELLNLLSRDGYSDYQEIERNYYCDKNCINTFVFFLKGKALDSEFDDISDFFNYWQQVLSKQLSYFQLLKKIDNWYEEIISQKEEPAVSIQKDEHNYNELAPDFEISELSKYLQNKNEYAYLLLNILFEHNYINEKCVWIPKPNIDIGAIRGIVRGYEIEQIISIGLSIRKEVFPNIRKLFKAGDRYTNSGTGLSDKFEEITLELLKPKRIIELKAV